MIYINRPCYVLVVIVTVAAVCLLSTAPLRASEVSVAYRFDEPSIASAGHGFTRITFPTTVQSGLPGEPGYPFRGAAILLPPGEAVSRVRIERRGWRKLHGSYRLRPVQLPVPIQEDRPRTKSLLLKEEAYRIDRWVYPPEPLFTTHFCQGHAIAVGCISPIAYHPKDGTVGYHREIEVTVETEPSAAAARSLELLRTDPGTNARIASIVDNAHDLAGYGYAPLAAPSIDSYEYLIVTRESLVNAFIPFCNYHTRRGMRTRIMTVEEIENSIPGSNTAERIRNAIIYEYTNRGITHVLLAGDTDGPLYNTKVVPHRGLYCVEPDQIHYDDNIPADVYFAALDGDWNTDGDNLWGEPGEEDLYPEIAIGRACVETMNEASRFVDKTMLYQLTPVAGQLRRALLLGEKLWDNPVTWGADELEELVGTCTANDITTTGIPTDFDTVNLFDRDIAHWDKNDAWSVINAGTHWVAHSGHCTEFCALRFYLNDVRDTKFTNDGVNANLIIVATAGCYAASFDNRGVTGLYGEDCIAEKMLKIQHCAVAFRGNSRYGWLDPGTTNSTSHLFLREFFDALFTEGYHMLGDADRRSKDEIVPYIELSSPSRAAEFRWDYYTINVLGDPALDPWTDTPAQLSVSHPASIGRYDLSIELFTPGIPGARAALFHDNVCYGRGVGSPLGYIVLHRLKTFPDSIDAIELNVNVHDHYTYRDTLAIMNTTGIDEVPSAVTLAQNAPNPFNPSTVIRFSLDTERFVDLRVYNVAGREVDRLINRRMEAGAHAVTWRPGHLPSGIYLYVLRTGTFTLSRKAVLLR
ncbi:MAG: T9SS type A sorting domain-containing protein [bacterium]|nr:MAG: T9SS type A sorting domain-containing protein [bacterium]